MGNESPTVVIAQLDDEKLRSSIDSLVSYVNNQFKSMVSTTNQTVSAMQQELMKLNDFKFDNKTTVDNGNTARTKANQTEKQSVADLQNEYYRLLGALQMATRQSPLLQEKWKKSLSTEDLIEYGNNLKRISELQKSLDSMRGKMTYETIEKHGQFTPNMKEYADGLIRTNDGLKKLNESFKEMEKDSQRAFRVGLANAMKLPTNNIDEIRYKWAELHSLVNNKEALQVFTPAQIANAKQALDEVGGMLQRHRTLQEQINADSQQQIEQTNQLAEAEKRYGAEIAQAAQDYRDLAGNMNAVNLEGKNGSFRLVNPTYNPEAKSLEEQLVAYKNLNQEADIRLNVLKAIEVEEQKSVQAAAESLDLTRKLKEEREAQANKKLAFAEYDDLQAAIASVIGVKKKEVNIADIETASYKELAATLAQLKLAYDSLNKSDRKSDQGKWLIDNMQDVQRAIQMIQSEARQPMNLDKIIRLPEKTIDDITYKVQMLSSYISGLDTVEQHDDIRKVLDIIEKLNEKAKETQKSTRQVFEDINKISFDKISKMPEGNFNEIGAKIKELEQHLMRLRSQPIYDEKAQKRTEDALDRLKAKYDKLKSQQGTEANVDAALNRTARTLDEIAQKIQLIQAVRSNLDVEKQKDLIDKLNNSLKELLKKQDDILGKNNLLKQSNDVLSRSWNYMRNRLAFYFTVGASTQFIKQLIDIRGQYEMLERSIGVLADSAQRGSEMFAQLNEMALNSPFTTIELGNAAKQLMAYDVAAKDVVDTTRRLADIAAATGASIERLAYALGHVQTYGYLNSLQARQFTNSGVPIVRELSKMYTELEGKMVSVSDVYDRMKKKAVGYADVQAVITRMTDENGRFFDYQAKTANTLRVQLANLNLAWNNMLNDIGKSNQGILSTGIKMLRQMLLAWKDVDKAILTIVFTFAAAKSAQLGYYFAVRNTNKAIALETVLGNKLATSIKGVSTAMKGLSASTGWIGAGIAALAVVMELLVESANHRDDMVELNKSIADGAKETSKSIKELTSSQTMMSAKAKAANKEMSNEEAEKVWADIRNEIELSANAYDLWIQELLSIQDINERVGKSFEYLDKIQEAADALSELTNQIDVSEDVAGGAFGEGLAEDIQDYTEAYDKLWAKLAEQGKLDQFDPSKTLHLELDEAKSEIEGFVKDTSNKLKNVLTPEQLADKTVVQEAIQRIIRAVEDKYPQISGVGKKFFESVSAKLFADEFGDSFDNIGFEFKKVLEKMSSESKSTFYGINESIYDTSEELNEKYVDAFNQAMGKMRKDAPKEMLDILDQLQREIDKNPLMLRYGIAQTFDISQVDDMKKKFMKDFNYWGGKESIEELGKNRAAYNDLYRQEGETNVKWAKRLHDVIEENKKEAEGLRTSILKAGVGMTDAEKQNDAIIQNYTKRLGEAEKKAKDAQQVMDWGDLVYKYDKKDKGAKKDVLGEALTKEIQLINEAQKRYSEYRKMGLSATDAQLKVSDEYNKSLANVSNTLAKFGIATKPMKELAYMDNRELKAYFQTLLDGATRLGNAKGIEAAEKAIANLNVEITKLDTKRITDGLNNDLSKIKDEYELQVELDATSGLGDALTNLLGIDTSDFPQTFEEYMSNVNQAFDKYRLEMSQWDSPWDVFTMSKQDVQDWGKRFGLDDETIKKVETAVKSQKDTYKKYVQDMVKNANSLEYELTDTSGKIAIKEKELSNTRDKLAKATTETERRYLQLTIQNQEKAIDELKAQALALLPEYDRVFGSIAEHSASVARKLQKDLLRVYDTAKFDAASKQYTLTGADGTTVYLDEERYTKERNKLIKDMQKTQSSFQKIKEAFNPSNKKDVVDYAKGIELIGQELSKLGELVSAIGNITEALGMNEESKEVIDDVSQTLSGIGQAAQGYAKFASGDYIGGASDMISGAFTAISTWFDNSDKKIQRSIQNSEMAVKRLELAYKDLQYAIEDAFGTATVGAEKAALANKTLQLTELKRQLTLQESRTGKNRDEDAIINLKGQIKDLEREIESGYKSIITNLLGISDVGSAVENMVQSVVNALRNGENAIDAWNTSIDDMIVNMITRFVSAQVVGPMFQKVIDDMTKTVAQRGATTAQELEEIKKQRDAKQAEVDEWSALYNRTGLNAYNQGATKLQEELDALNKQIVELEDQAKQQTEFTKQDLEYMVEHLAELKANGGDWMSYLQELLEQYGLMGGANETQLSNLQQGIQGITEDTAGALEAYMNSVSQQVYLHSDLLTQIRDVVVTLDFDMQTSVMSQMLLQLQSSYQVQMSIQNILLGVLNPSGMAMRVELAS